MVKEIDLNCDLGESFGVYSYGMDEKIMPYISTANVACGFHGGDPHVMRKTIELAHLHSVRIGAHIGFPDRLGFGRREISISSEDAYDYILYQLGALFAFLKTRNIKLNHVKLHGAFYIMACYKEEIANATVKAVSDFDRNLELYTLPECPLVELAANKGIKVMPEYFADRPYDKNGVKMFNWNREELGTEKEMALAAKESVSVEGSLLKTICVHSDTPGSFSIIKELYNTFSNDSNFSIR